MHIDELWDRLEPETRQWLVDNPGCRILPRSVAASMIKATGVQFEQDRHGETLLSRRDCDFLHSKADVRGAGRSRLPDPRP